MSETLFAYTIVDAGYSEGTAGAINGDRGAAPSTFTAQKNKIRNLNSDPALFNFIGPANKSLLALRQYTYNPNELLENQIIDPFATSWTQTIAKQTWSNVLNLHAVATSGNWLYATGYDLARIAVVNMRNNAYTETTSYQFPTAWPAISVASGAACHGEALTVVGSNLYALFTVNPGGSWSEYDDSIVVKFNINAITGALTYAAHIAVGKNAFTLEHFNNKLYVCALGGPQNAGSANTGTSLDIIDLTGFTKTSVKTTAAIGGDFRDIAIVNANSAYILVGHYDASFYNLVGGIYHTSAANIASPASWTKVVAVNNPGYLWGIYADTNRLWFVKGTPVDVFASLPTAAASPARTFTATDMGDYAGGSLNSATIVAANPSATALTAFAGKTFSGHAILAQQARKSAEVLKAANEAAAGQEKK